ncbi:Uncharacterised protein [Serratia quinivorans]|nr:Uncharacterised protein [Serratia quinivorans]
MPGYLFTRLSYEVPFDGAEYINEGDVSRVIPLSVIPQAGFANFLFHDNEESLKSLDGNYQLTTASSFTPTFTSHSVVLPAVETFNGLRTPFTDSANQTVTAVIKYTGAVSQILLGCISDTAGEAITLNSSGVISYLYRTSAGLLVANTIPSPDLTVGDYIFIGYSRTAAGVIAMIGGAPSVLTLPSAAKGVSANWVGLGNTIYGTAGFSKGLEGMELLYSAAGGTATDLQSVYANSKLRCLARGHVIK